MKQGELGETRVTTMSDGRILIEVIGARRTVVMRLIARGAQAIEFGKKLVEAGETQVAAHPSFMERMRKD